MISRLAAEVEIAQPRVIALSIASIAMATCGAVFANGLPDPVSIALIVVGAGMFFIGMLLPTLTEFQIGPSGFSATLRHRDEEIEAALSPETKGLLRLAVQLAGGEARGEELLEEALVETYMKWSQARAQGPATTVRQELRNLAPQTREGVE